jgi:hypothetical protein
MKSIALVGLTFSWQLFFTAAAPPQSSRFATYGAFVATTPCDTAVRAPLRIPTTANCELLQWSLVLSQDANTQAPTSYRLRVTYGYLAESTYQFRRGAPDVVREGSWTITRGVASAKDAIVFRLDGDKRDLSITLLKLDDNVLHLVDRSQHLVVGTSSWSYSLNRTGNPLPARLVASTLGTTPDSATQEHFEGRSPCRDIALQLGMDVTSACNKAKWELILNRDPTTHAPTTYTLKGTLYRQHIREGRWTIVRGTSSNPNAIVYQLLASDARETLLLARADENILFFLDKNTNLLVGDADFSYTLNRR